MKKLVSILLTLAVAVSLLVVPAAVSASTETVNITSNPSATITKTDNLDAGVVEFNVKINETPPWGGHCQDAAAVYISADNSTLDFQVKYFNFLNENIPSVTEFGWYYRDGSSTNIFDDIPFILLDTSGTGITATGKPGEPTGSQGELYYETFTIDIPIDLLGGEGATYYYAIGWSTNVIGRYPESGFATASVPANTEVSLTANVEEAITAISVTPSSIDFGRVIPGQSYPGANITVKNIGEMNVSVDASLEPLTGTVFNYLKLGGNYSQDNSGLWSPIIESLLSTYNETFSTELVVPSYYIPRGVENATLIFTATTL